MSAAIRGTIDMARIFADLLSSPDPQAGLKVMLDAAERDAARDAYFDHHGHYPEDAPQ